MQNQTITIATRKSPLALWQANYIKQQLEALHSGIDVELLPMTSQGDKLLDISLAKIGGKGLFLKELETALLAETADLAVHSMKDVPVDLSDSFEIIAICERQDPRDAFISNQFNGLNSLPKGARVGTSSLRRQSQLKKHYPDMETIGLRGNINTRLQKLDQGQFDGIVLAQVGLTRLGLDDRINQTIAIDKILPAVGQGALGIEICKENKKVKELLTPLHHVETGICVQAEREVSRLLGGSCHLPIAVHGYSTFENSQQTIHLKAIVSDLSGKQCICASTTGLLADSMRCAEQVAEDLLRQGAQSILEKLS